MVRKPPVPTVRRSSKPLSNSSSGYIAPIQQKINMRNYNKDIDYTQKENVQPISQVDFRASSKSIS